MATQDGPNYPGPQEGLVYCFDAKNRDCWSGGNTFNNLQFHQKTKLPDGTLSAISGSGVNISSDELEGMISNEGYITLDGTDDIVPMGPVSGSITSGTPGNASTWAAGSCTSAFQVEDELTISVWCRPRLGAWHQRPFSYTGLQGTSGYGIKFNYAWNAWAATPTNSEKTAYWKNNNSTADWIVTNTWYNVVARKKANGISDNLSCWVNGVEGNTGASTYGTVDGIEYNKAHAYYWPTRATIGSGGWRSSDNYMINEFNGDISIVMVYDRAWSDGEIVNHFNRLKDRFGL